jgi:hypothetical protein
MILLSLRGETVLHTSIVDFHLVRGGNKPSLLMPMSQIVSVVSLGSYLKSLFRCRLMLRLVITLLKEMTDSRIRQFLLVFVQADIDNVQFQSMSNIFLQMIVSADKRIHGCPLRFSFNL